MEQPLDPTSLAGALREHHEAAWAWAMACCHRDRDAAHDVLHDAYVTILERRAKFRGRSSFRTWLFGVIRVSALAARRKRALMGLLLEPLCGHAELEAEATRSNLIATALGRALTELPLRQRQVAALVFEHDLTIEEAASVLGVSQGACRRHYARAKDKLRAALNDGEVKHE